MMITLGALFIRAFRLATGLEMKGQGEEMFSLHGRIEYSIDLRLKWDSR